MRPSILEVDINKFKQNIENIQKYVGEKTLMPIIKANAYGTYINKNIDLINKFDIVGLAVIDEAIELRKLGYQKNIFVLNQPFEEELNDIIKYNLTIGLSDSGFLEKIIKSNEKVKVHLEIETGMNRTGIKLEQLEEFVEKIKQASNVEVEGIYTHFSSADDDDTYTKQQIEVFKKAVDIVKKSFNTIKYIHSSASNGLINYNDDITNLVRPGIIMYGYESFESAKTKINIQPICKLKTKVTFLKQVDTGASISYSRKYNATKPTKVATIPIGYADGLRRELSNKGFVIINNQKAPIIGNICMDSCMIDVTDVKGVEIGSDVYIWDNELQTLEEIANKCNTINYEILSTISYRVPRVFVK